MPFNPHPPLTSFPIAGAVLLALLELAATRVAQERASFARRFLLAAYGVFIALAYFSGSWGLEHAMQPDLPHPLADGAANAHQSIARLCLILAFPLLLFGFLLTAAAPRWIRAAYVVVLTLSTLLMLYTGLLGGRLVFEHGAAVSLP